MKMALQHHARSNSIIMLRRFGSRQRPFASFWSPCSAEYDSFGSTCRNLSSSSSGSSSLASGSYDAQELTRATEILRRRGLLDDYLKMILTSRVYDVAEETPLQYARTLSSRTKNNIFLKREDTQPVFSFKIRGAYNKIANLTEEERKRGIVACSAGNHAQGVAMSAVALGIERCAIIMPIATPGIKVASVGAIGVEPILHGENFDEAAAEARRLEKEEGYTMVHPFDDPHVIAGQGTIGMEIVKQITNRLKDGQKPLDSIFACVGGGGLLAGIAAYVKRVAPHVKVYGVEAADAACMTRSLECGERVELETVGLFADGAAVRMVGENTFSLCSELVDGMVTVSTDEICAAIKDGFNDTRCVLEPAGALAIAGLNKFLSEKQIEGNTCVAIASGANMDFDRLRFVSERADFTEALISVVIPEKPGAFAELYSLVYPRNVTEFSYRNSSHIDASRAHIYMSFQCKGASVGDAQADAETVVERLRCQGYDVANLEENEMAKVHARHLAGGRANLTNERLLRFEFPEKPGALKLFLQCLSGETERLKGGKAPFDCSLFHYRNHGADIARVLVGLQVPPESDAKLEDFLGNLGYRYYDETNNAVYEQFLR